MSLKDFRPARLIQAQGGVFTIEGFTPNDEITHDLEPNSAVLLEIQDIYRAVELEMTGRAGHPNDDVKPSAMKFILNPKDARTLCCHILNVLANGGDRIATRLVEVMNEELDRRSREILDDLESDDDGQS